MTIGIYCIENIINGKKYIGQSVNLRRRILEHCNKLESGKDSSVALQNAYNKYGVNNFIFYVLEECREDELDEREIFFINDS